MPAVAPLEELRAAERDIQELRSRMPEAVEEVCGLLRRHRKIGYRNFCRLMLGETTPEELKTG